METSEIRIVEIQESHRRVEAEKAWEVSWTRRFFIGFFTYIVTVLFFSLIGVPRPILSGFALFCGFVISSGLLSFIKRGFIKRWDNNN